MKFKIGDRVCYNGGINGVIIKINPLAIHWDDRYIEYRDKRNEKEVLKHCKVIPNPNDLLKAII